MTGREKAYQSCHLCPRSCGVDRARGERGRCGEGSTPRAALATLHMWEEPCISGEKGSGAVFFSGCPVGCIFCQNREIAAGRRGREVDRQRLSEIFLELQGKGAANLNLVTAVHFVPTILDALDDAKRQGFSLPVVYNSSGYETVDTLKSLEGYVDIYLPDFKYMDPALAERYSHASDYPETAQKAVEEMVRQQPRADFDGEGYLRAGVIVRHLILPGHTRDSMAVLDYLKGTFGDQIYVSIMNQYTPLRHVALYPEINRKVTRREYEKVLDYAIGIGMEQAFIQEGQTAEESFIPMFDCEGISRE